MLTFKDFIDEESNSSSGRFTRVFITRILEKIKELQEDKIEKYAFAFNIYNLEIDLKNQEVEINTIFDDDNFLRLSLDDFYIEMFNHYEL